MRPLCILLTGFCSIVFIILNSCKKEKIDDQMQFAQIEIKILNDFPNSIAFPSYQDLNLNSSQLNSQVSLFILNPSDSLLQEIRNSWRATRQNWELSESFLFGPVEDFNYDPMIDDWPVNQVDLDSIISLGANLTANDMLNFPTSLKGFHPIEYLIFGEYGNKSASQFTPAELNYLSALSSNLLQVTTELKYSWELTNPLNYNEQFSQAGGLSSRFESRNAAFTTMVNALIDICDEVANSKLEEPLLAQDSLLEESHFSHNSLSDFKNNIIGIRNVYTGYYKTEHTGLNELVSLKNKELDIRITDLINQSIGSFNSINTNYGLAIFTDQIQIHSCQENLNALKELLEEELKPFINQYVID